jgi:endo-1,4-beta-D-glucanase Y
MKLNKYTWIFVGLIAAVYLGTLIWVRLTNPVYLQKNMYQTWENSYVMHPKSDQSFVNTSQNPVVLSESQGYGMLITVRAAQKGWANQKDFDRFVNYWLAHRDYVGDHHQTETYLMSWRQYYNRHHQWVNDINSATDGDVYIAMAGCQTMAQRCNLLSQPGQELE